MVLNRFQRVANVCAVSPENIKEERDVSLTEVSPGVVEVNLTEVGKKLNEAAGENFIFPSIKGDSLTEEQQLQLQAQGRLRMHQCNQTQDPNRYCRTYLREV